MHCVTHWKQGQKGLEDESEKGGLGQLEKKMGSLVSIYEGGEKKTKKRGR